MSVNAVRNIKQQENEYEPPDGMFQRALKGIDKLYYLTDENPAQWSIAKSCAFFALGLLAMDKCNHILEAI